jgi:hypothetical protein
VRRAASPPPSVNRHAKTNPFKERTTVMSHVTTTLSAGVIAAVLAAAAVTPASAAAPDKAAVKQATVTCKAQVKEQAKYNEMSWYARHKAVKSCVAEALAKH